ncbi:MAG: NAD(P)-dependent oxidoreductase [SAR324 cluster bacterium]|nr:NAD(P)-dependent oxidoreductase [SAR324 cluster bacterium]
MRILVIGAAGYLGAKLSDLLISQGHEVIALMREIPKNAETWTQRMTRIIEGDVRHESTWDTLQEESIDAAVYLISLNHKQSEGNIGEVIDINVTSMWRALSWLNKNNLKQFIYLSTQQVYGILPPVCIDETFPLSPQNNYALTHIMCEEICYLFNNRKPVHCVNVRVSNGFGAPVFMENDCWWLAINNMCELAIKYGAIQLLSDGTPQRDFIHIDDICRGISMLLTVEKSYSHTHTYNLGSGQTLTILQLAHRVANCFQQKFGRQIPVLLPGGVQSQSDHHHDSIPKFEYQVQKLKALGFSPQKTLEQGILDVMDYLVRHKTL